MKLAFSSLPVIVFIALVSQSQQSASLGALQSEAKPDLEVTTRITEQKYCSGSSMLLSLQLEYKNIAKQKLILLKYALPPSEYRVSKNAEAASQKRYETIVTLMLSPNSGGEQFGDEPPNDYFVILDPGQSYTPIQPIRVPLSIADVDKGRSADYLSPGEHVVQLNISPWPFATNSEQELRTRWQRFGYLWTKDVLSIPMVFRVGKGHDRTLSNCNLPAGPR